MGESFGAFLRSLRKQKKKTQRDLAGEVGVDFTYLSKVENETPGFLTVSEGTLLRLAEALDSDPDEMRTRAGKSHRNSGTDPKRTRNLKGTVAMGAGKQLDETRKLLSPGRN